MKIKKILFEKRREGDREDGGERKKERVMKMKNFLLYIMQSVMGEGITLNVLKDENKNPMKKKLFFLKKDFYIK